METKRRLSCIVCPLSCTIEVVKEDDEIKSITGHTCQRGKTYAEEEVTAPKRMLTTTVRVINGELPLLPVISKTALPKERIVACARCLSFVEVKAPISEGDVVYPNIMNLGVDIVATRDMKVASK